VRARPRSAPALGFPRDTIFDHEDVDEILNLQPVGSKAKPYQVRDVRDIILNYGLVSHEDE
jgi:hypothetical protein